MLYNDEQVNPELMVAVNTLMVEQPVSRLQELSDRFYELREELKNEYVQMFSNDADTLDSIDSIEDHGTLRYTYKGLVKSIPMEFNDFDDVAQEALDEFCNENNVEADLTLNLLSRKVDNYLIYVDHGSNASLTLSQEGKEVSIPMSRQVRRQEEIEELLKTTAFNHDFKGLVLKCDEFGNVTIVS